MTKCKIQKQQLALVEKLKKPGASATTAVECNNMLLESVGQSGTAGSLVSMSISMDRTSQPDALTVKSVKIKDISKMYYYVLKYDGDGVSMGTPSTASAAVFRTHRKMSSKCVASASTTALGGGGRGRECSRQGTGETRNPKP